MLTYHEKIGLWRILVCLRSEYLGTFEVFRKRRAQMGIFERAQILGFGCIGGADLSRLDSEFGLSESPAIEELFIYIFVSDTRNLPRRVLI